MFIDDHSQKSWIYFLNVKSETFDKFKEFKALIENQISIHIRILRSDNGGEYESNEFDDFFREARIKKELIIPYKPKQNGVVERKNKIICEVVKAMLIDLDLPLSLWVEAACTAVYIQNRSPHAILGAKTLEEVFTSKKPAVDHMRIFSTPVYVHVPKEKRAKPDPSVKKGIFAGYNDCSKAYRVYIPGQRHIKVSRDVIFREEVVFRKTLELSTEDEVPPLEFLDS